MKTYRNFVGDDILFIFDFSGALFIKNLKIILLNTIVIVAKPMKSIRTMSFEEIVDGETLLTLISKV